MGETLSIQEIQTCYDGEWVLIGDPEVDASLHGQRGQVLWQSKDHDEVYRQARKRKPKCCAFLFMGRLPEDMEVVL